MFCKHCGKGLPDDFGDFCTYCGQVLNYSESAEIEDDTQTEREDTDTPVQTIYAYQSKNSGIAALIAFVGAVFGLP